MGAVKRIICRLSGCDEERLPDSSVYSMHVRVFRCRRCGVQRWEQIGERGKAATPKGGD